jgi:hypothetical protein
MPYAPVRLNMGEMVMVVSENDATTKTIVSTVQGADSLSLRAQLVRIFLFWSFKK